MNAAPGRPANTTRSRAQRVLSLIAALAAVGLGSIASPALAAGSAQYAPREVIVGYQPAADHARGRASAALAGEGPAVHTTLVKLRPGTSLSTELARLRGQRGVEWAVPDYRAHIAVTPAPYVPDDPGRPGGPAGGWEELQWNFVGEFGVHAPEAWANLIADGAPGGKGVIVAVLDTGVAYANRGPFRRSPDFTPYEFVKGYDFVAHSPYPNDRNGHGTFVAATIAEATNNGRGLTGLAYGARIMPVRVRSRRSAWRRRRRRRSLHDRRRRLFRSAPRGAGDQPQPRVFPGSDRL